MVHVKKYKDITIVFLFSLIIAAVATVPDSDQISIWILNFIDGMPLADFTNHIDFQNQQIIIWLSTFEYITRQTIPVLL